MPWGSQTELSTGAVVKLLKPLPHDYLQSFKRVTQVIYPKDLAFMVFISGIQPGSKVLEAGVGTGYLTATLARFVGDEGKVYGYEIREDFLRVAESNLRRANLLKRVELKLRDIREGIDERDLDAAFLDLPDPWETLNEVFKALKPSAPVVVFMPTANQVIKLLKVLSTRNDVVDLRVYDLTLREYQIDPEAFRPQNLGIVHTGYIVFFRKVK